MELTAPSLEVGPQGLLANPKEVGDGPAGTGMRHPAGEPALNGLGVDADGAAERLDGDSGVRHRFSQRLVCCHSGI